MLVNIYFNISSWSVNRTWKHDNNSECILQTNPIGNERKDADQY